MAYISDESGLPELYLRSFPAGEGKRRISNGGAEKPRWVRNGKEILVVRDGRLFSLPVASANGALSIGTAVELFRSRGLALNAFSYDVTRDGQRFLIAEPTEDAPLPAIHVIQHWPALLHSPR